MELEEDAAHCLRSLLTQQIKNEADARVEKLQAAIRLADSVRDEFAPPRCQGGADAQEWFRAGAGVLKGEDPLYISAITAILGAGASALSTLHERLEGGEGRRKLLESHLHSVSRGLLLQTCEGARRLLALYKTDRNPDGLARSARDGLEEHLAALRSGTKRLDLVLDELAHLLMVCNRFLGFSEKFKGGGVGGVGWGGGGGGETCGFEECHNVVFDQELQALAGHFVVLEEFYLNSCVARARLSQVCAIVYI
jgi:hypothetical protein